MFHIVFYNFVYIICGFGCFVPFFFFKKKKGRSLLSCLKKDLEYSLLERASQ